jgi:hypothetical protein
MDLTQDNNMAHYARLNEANKVVSVHALNNVVITDSEGNEQEQMGIDFLHQQHGGLWAQTSYNSRIRKNFAGTGYMYDPTRDAFIPPKPFDSWLLNEDTCLWGAPTPCPEDDKIYSWDEATTSWKSHD